MIHQILLDLISKNIPFIEITIVEARGSVPSNPGSKAIITHDGIYAGTVGGGKVEAKAILLAKEILEKQKSETHFVTWNLQKDVGMTCGGEMKLFFQPYNLNKWTIAVFGAGHVAQELVPLLTKLNCRVYCIDSRAEWLDKISQRPNLTTVNLQNPSEFVSRLPKDTFFISMTQGHATDLPILQEILKRDYISFVGVIGSQSKSKVLKNDLVKLGLDTNKISQIVCPIGLKFGDNSPFEISMSIISQLLVVRDLFLDNKKNIEIPTKMRLIHPDIENIN